LQNFTPLSAFLGGSLIGLSAVLLLWCNGRIAGISSIMNGLFQPDPANYYWRACFLLGLLAGSAAWFQLTDAQLPIRPNASSALIAAGGFLVGLGTRIGSGCTSGHGICGIALLSVRSILATLTFMLTGILSVYLVRHVLGVLA